MDEQAKDGYVRVRVEIPNLKAKRGGFLRKRSDKAKNADVHCDFEDRYAVQLHLTTHPVFLLLFLRYKPNSLGKQSTSVGGWLEGGKRGGGEYVVVGGGDKWI